MTTTETTDILRNYNEWIRGYDDALRPTTKDIAEAIDAAVEMIERMELELRLIAETDPVDAALDPQRAIRIARNALEESR